MTFTHSLAFQIVQSIKYLSNADEESVNIFMWVLDKALHHEALIQQTPHLKEYKSKLHRIKMMFANKMYNNNGSNNNLNKSSSSSNNNNMKMRQVYFLFVLKFTNILTNSFHFAAGTREKLTTQTFRIIRRAAKTLYRTTTTYRIKMRPVAATCSSQTLET
jgi:hypothetical protein